VYVCLYGRERERERDRERWGFGLLEPCAALRGCTHLREWNRVRDR